MSGRKSYLEIKRDIESKEAILISETYTNSLAPLVIKCKCGNIFERPYKTFMNGMGLCLDCTEVERRKRGRSFTSKEVE